MAKARSWWKLRQVRHRDAFILAVLSFVFLLAGELPSNIATIYARYIGPNLDKPLFLIPVLILVLFAFTTYFGAIFVLLGGLHFSWGNVPRGRFFIGFGLGISLLGLVGRLAQAILSAGTPAGQPFGLPPNPLLALSTNAATGIGLLFGLVSHTLMGRYALMFKKRARQVWRRWRKSKRPSTAIVLAMGTTSSTRTGHGARRRSTGSPPPKRTPRGSRR